jgi:archaellum component FlaF (FlaF/FlaG flagellin family)
MTFKRLILLSALTVILGVSVVYALSYESKIKNSIQTISTARGVDEQAGLEITMQLEKTEYSLGEQICITVTITNIGNQAINFSYTAWSFDFLVYNNTDNNIYQWSNQIFPQYVVNMPLDPGMGLTRVLVWPQTCNITTLSEGVPVSAGTYFIIGQAGYEYELQTTPIQVTIVNP